MNKDTKILVGLFAIVILCSAKLFKDYLYRNRYVEGMTIVSQESTVQLRRQQSGAITSDLMFTIRLGADLLTTQTLSVAWSGTIGSNDVVFPTTLGSAPATNYTATATGSTFTSALTDNGSPAIFTPSSTIPSGTPILITIKGVQIHPKNTNTIENVTFTITAGREVAETRDVKILPYIDTASGSQFTSASGATIDDIRLALDGINTRINTLRNINTDVAALEISRLEKTRTAMIALLTSTYGTIKEAGQVFESGALYEAQKTAIEFIRTEKARAAANADALSSDNLNKRRMAQINTYYTRNYEANTEVMKNVIYVSIALIILAVLRKKELIPGSISTLGVIFVLTMGGIVIGKQVFDIMRRNDSDFDKYDWNFNEDQMNQQKLIQQNAEPASLSDMGIGGAPCYGASCCAVGTSWDATSSRCVPSSRITGTAKWSTSASTSTLTVKLTTTVALVAEDTVTIELPTDGLFQRTISATAPRAGGSSFTTTDATNSDKTFIIPVSSTVSGGTITITISGLTVNPAAKFGSTKMITAFTSKETNPSGIPITGNL
jgi:hypothetical protein